MKTKQTCQVKFHILLLVILISVGGSDRYGWVEDMEDAFANDEGSICKKNSKDKFVVCRFQRDEKLSLSSLNPCTCTHILFVAELLTQSTRDLAALQSYKLHNAELQILPSINVNVDHLLNISLTSQNVTAWMRGLQLDGIDVRIEQKTFQEDSLKIRLFEYLQSIGTLLRTRPRHRTLSLTVIGSSLPFLNDPLLQTVLSYIDLLSVVPSYVLHSFQLPNDGNSSDLSQEVEIAVKLGISKNRILVPISLRRSLEYVTQEAQDGEIYPRVCKYLDSESDDEERRGNNSHTHHSQNKGLWNILRNQVHYAVTKDVAGIDVWSLNDDDSNNICNKNPFPLINHISAEIKGEKSFGSFTDLDIILSTGESQITKEIQILHEQNSSPEIMKQFKCERIGFFRHPTDCSKFYHCSEYRATTTQPTMQYAIVIYKCPRGLVYDEVQDSCNWPSHTEPCQGSDELMPVTQKKFACATPGFHVDPEDCRWFYYCSDLGDGQLVAFEFLCPSHFLGFDEKHLLCNWKWMVPVCANSNATNQKIDHEVKHFLPEISPVTEFVKENNALRVNNHAPNIVIIPTLSTQRPRYAFDDTAHPNVHRTFESQPVNVSTKTQTLNKIEEEFLKRSAISQPSDSSMEHENITPIPNSENKANVNNSPRVHVGNYTEKKYGTAYWHRSMVTSNSRNSRHNESERNSRTSTTNLRTKDIQFGNATQVEQKYGIGSVRKIHLNGPPTLIKRITLDENLSLNIKSQDRTNDKHQNNVLRNSSGINGYNSYYDVNSPVHFQGRSVSGIVSTNGSQNKIVHHQEQVSTKSPYATVKCSKFREKKSTKNDSKISDEGDFGCSSEVSLVINLKQGKDFEKYILNSDKIINSAFQESKQVAFATNDKFQKDTLQSQNAQEEGNGKTIPSYSNKIRKDEDALRTPKELPNGGRIQKPNEPIFQFLKKQAVHYDVNDRIETQRVGKLPRDKSPTDESVNLNEQSLDHKNEPRVSNSFATSLRKTDNNKDTGTLAAILDEKKSKDSFTSKENLMPLSFYPQGVLINVDLDHINEIPPQVLYEVDRMLKKYMSDGNINIDLLMSKLNATAEKMSEVENNATLTNTKISKMLTMLGDILNSTGDMILLRDNSTEAYTHENMNASDTATMTNELDSTTEEYENITKLYETPTFNHKAAPDAESNTDLSKQNESSISSNSNSPIIEVNTLNSDQNINDTPSNVYFGRRRLFRKPKYPSIREQLEMQKLYLSRNSTNDTLFSNPMTETISNRFRYPSIRDQLNLNLYNVPRQDLLSKDRRKLESEIIPVDTKNEYFIPTPRTQQFDELEFSNPVTPMIPNRFKYPSIREQLNLKASNVARHSLSEDRQILESEVTPKVELISNRAQQFGDRIRVAGYTTVSTSDRQRTPSLSTKITNNEVSGNAFRNAAIPHFGNERFHSGIPSNAEFGPGSIDGKSERVYDVYNTGYNTPSPSDRQRTPSLTTKISNNDVSGSAFRNAAIPHFGNERFRSGIPLNAEFGHGSKDGKSERTHDVYKIVPSQRSKLEASQFQYTLPLPPIHHPKHMPATVSQAARAVENFQFRTTGRSSTGDGSVRLTTNTNRNVLRRRKGRKLRVLVRKLPNGVNDFSDDHVPNNDQPEIKAKIPKNLLTELRTKVLKKLAVNGNNDIELQIRYQDHVWNVPFVNNRNAVDISPAACTRAGLFQHPKDCNMFYECFWDKWLRKFTLHVFSCPVKLVYDDNIRGCSRPSLESHCRNPS